MRHLLCIALLAVALTRCAHPSSSATRSTIADTSSVAARATSPTTSASPIVESLAIPAHGSYGERGLFSEAESGLPTEVRAQRRTSDIPTRITGHWQWNSAHGPRLLSSVCFEANPTLCVLTYSVVREADNGERSFMAPHGIDADARGGSPLEVDLLRSTARRLVVRGANGQCTFTVAIDSQPDEEPTANEIGEPVCVAN